MRHRAQPWLLAIVVVLTLAAPIGAQGFAQVSVKPSASAIPADFSSTPSCSRSVQAAPGRLAVSNTTVYGLMVLAYGKSCLLLSGGPDWTHSDRFDIDALLPQGSPRVTAIQLENFNAPKIQEMIQALLAQRFALTTHREMREMLVYDLVVVKPGKVKPSENQNPSDDVTLPLPPPILKREQRCPCLGGFPMSTGRLARLLQGEPLTGRPVIDKTGLNGLFDIYVEFALDRLDAANPSIFTAIEEQVGFKLESARRPVEVLVIDQVERPAAN